MTTVAFHTDVTDKVRYTYRLARKAVGQGLRVCIAGQEGDLDLLDQALWTFSPLEFLPHCTPVAPSPMRQASAVLLTEAVQADWHRQVLINLGESVPDGFDAFERIIDVVTLDDLHRAQGRERWREYTRLGHELVRHDLQQASTT